MTVEQRGPAACNVSDHKEGKDELINASGDLQDLRRRIYVKAKAETSWRFWGLYVHVCKMETLRVAYALAKKNDGAPGIDGVTFDDIEKHQRSFDSTGPAIDCGQPLMWFLKSVVR